VEFFFKRAIPPRRSRGSPYQGANNQDPKAKVFHGVQDGWILD
jgi:hypothetical protein